MSFMEFVEIFFIGLGLALAVNIVNLIILFIDTGKEVDGKFEKKANLDPNSTEYLSKYMPKSKIY